LASDDRWNGAIGDITVGHFPAVTTFRTPNTPAPEEAWPSNACYPLTAANGLLGCIVAPDYPSQIYASRSKHVGGALAARCDGSVSFVSDEVDFEAWRRLGSAQGGETIAWQP
jgi:hypothetical protein